jgi:outer membrane protein
MKRAVLAVLATALAIPAFAQTAPSKVAVINVPKVLAESNSGKAAFERLKKMQEDRAARAQKMNDELKTLDGQLKSRSMSLSDDKLAEMGKQFDEKKIALQRYAQDAERELGEAREKSLQDIEKQLRPIIDQIGKEMGFAVIFNKYESGLVYASEAIDISDIVIKRFNEAKPAAAAAVRP